MLRGPAFHLLDSCRFEGFWNLFCTTNLLEVPWRRGHIFYDQYFLFKRTFLERPLLLINSEVLVLWSFFCRSNQFSVKIIFEVTERGPWVSPFCRHLITRSWATSLQSLYFTPYCENCSQLNRVAENVVISTGCKFQFFDRSTMFIFVVLFRQAFRTAVSVSDV